MQLRKILVRKSQEILECHYSVFPTVEQWGVATGTNAQAGVTSKAVAIFPIAYEAECYHVMTSLKNGGTSGRWESTCTWAQNYQLTSTDCYIVANHSLSDPAVAYVAFGV